MPTNRHKDLLYPCTCTRGKRDKEMVLEKCVCYSRSTSCSRKIEERIGSESLWENALGCDERCMRKIQW